MHWKPYLSISLVLSATACQTQTPTPTPPEEIQFTISSQPQSLSVAAGQAAQFEVTAKGQSLTYQWQKNGIDIPNATNRTYTLAQPTAADHGAKFTVRVSSSTGSLLSRSAVLVVNTQPGFPTIKVQPKSMTVAAGQIATFTVEAEGTGLKYAWYKNGYLAPLGGDKATYTTLPTDATYKDAKIMVVVYNDQGRTFSQEVTLTVTGSTMERGKLRGQVYLRPDDVPSPSFLSHGGHKKFSQSELKEDYDQVVSSLIIKFKLGSEVPEYLRVSQNLKKARPLALEGTYLYQLSSPINDLEAKSLIDQLQQNSNVVYAVPNKLVSSKLPETSDLGVLETIQAASLNLNSAYPNDPLFDRQWNMTAIQAKEAWEKEGLGPCNQFVNVAVVDSGLFPHTDLTRVLPGYDFISDPELSLDEDGRDSNTYDDVKTAHGTHIAGVIAAETNNAVGIAGISKCTKILPVRVSGKWGNWDIPDAIDGLMWAIGNPVPDVPNNLNPARIISMSLSGPSECDSLWQDVIDQILAKNVLMVVSAGNRSSPVTEAFPAGCRGVIPVGSTNGVNDMPYYSSYGPNVLLAPGGDLYDDRYVLSTVGENKYGNQSGTSMAVPHVTGIAAMVLSKEPSLSVEQLRNRLINSAQEIPACESSKCGYGLVSALRALDPTITAPLSPSKVLVILRKPGQSEIYRKVAFDTSAEAINKDDRTLNYQVDDIEEGEYHAEVCLDKNNNAQCDPGEANANNGASTNLEGDLIKLVHPIELPKEFRFEGSWWQNLFFDTF